MAKLLIEIDETGVTLVSISGVVLGLLQSLEVTYDENLHPVPRIHVSFATVAADESSPDSIRLRRTLQQYKDELRKHPLVRVSDYRDTLPQGMPAVRVEEG